MGLLDKVLDIVAGKDPEVKAAEARMKADIAVDPRRRLVHGILAVTYDVDPAYLTEHAKTAMRDWYGVESAAEIDTYRFGSDTHAAYNLYRRVFLARAGFGAGLLDERGSWERALAQAQVMLRTYASWDAYGRDYLEGHIAYRTQQGDPAPKLAQYRENIGKRLATQSRTVWKQTPWAF